MHGEKGLSEIYRWYCQLCSKCKMLFSSPIKTGVLQDRMFYTLMCVMWIAEYEAHLVYIDFLPRSQSYDYYQTCILLIITISLEMYSENGIFKMFRLLYLPLFGGTVPHFISLQEGDGLFSQLQAPDLKTIYVLSTLNIIIIQNYRSCRPNYVLTFTQPW